MQEGVFALDPPGDDGHAHFALTTVTDAATGTWQATVDWTFGFSTLWMWVASGVCTGEQFALPECPFDASCPCQFVIRSETSSPKPRVLTIPSAQGGTRTLIILNLGPREESGNYRVTLTPTTSATLEGLADSPVSSARAAGSVSTGTKSVRSFGGRR